MEEPKTRVISNEAESSITIWPYRNRISPDGRIWSSIISCVSWNKSAFFARSLNDLEIVTVKMEWMLSRIVVIDSDFNYLTLFQDIWIAVRAVYFRICSGIAKSHG